MPTQVRERAMSNEERQFLQGMADSPTSLLGPLRLAVNVGVASWFIAMTLIVLCWILVAWLVRISTGMEIGLHSAAAHRVLPMSWLASAVVAVVTAVLWVTVRKNDRLELLADLKAGRVVEEDYEFTAAMRMQEQEHGGLFYFLRSTDGAVLVLFDYESQDIGVQGDDPLTNSFKPRTRLTMVRAPETRLVIDKTFSGDSLDAGDPLDLLASPNDWPEDDEFCDIPWDNLEATFCR